MEKNSVSSDVFLGPVLQPFEKPQMRGPQSGRIYLENSCRNDLARATELADGTEVRHITMEKAIHFDQIAADWQPNHRVRWLYRFASDSFPAGALDEHVRIGGAYFDVIDTEYELLNVGYGTELRVRMKYRVSTGFN